MCNVGIGTTKTPEHILDFQKDDTCVGWISDKFNDLSSGDKKDILNTIQLWTIQEWDKLKE